MKAQILVSIIAAICASALESRAQFIWTGAGGDSSVLTPGNWQGGVAPTGNGTEDLAFDTNGIFTPTFSAAFSVHNITIGAVGSTYTLSGSGPLTLTGDITAQLYTYSDLKISAPLALATGLHTVSLGGIETPSSDVYLFGQVSGTGDLAKYGTNSLTFDHAGNTFSGYVDLQEGTLWVHGDGTLGTGLVKMNGGTLVAIDSYNDNHTTVLGNNFSLSTNNNFGTYNGTGSITITGTTTIQTGVTSAYITANGTGLLTFNGLAETDPQTLVAFQGYGVTRITGPSTYTGGTAAIYGGTVTFGAAVPAVGILQAAFDGYIGSEVTTSVQSGFLDHFNKVGSAYGIVGFDSPNLNSPQTFSEAIDLTGFDPSVKLGTATSAILGGTITPQATAYQFGGRGTLTVTSALGGTNSVDASKGLLLYLNGTNSYSGTTYSSYGAAIVFNSAGALPAGTTLGNAADGYVGQTETAGLSAVNFLSKFVVGSTGGVVGFDAANPLTGRSVTDAVDLSLFGGNVFIGTSTTATLSGLITPSLLGTQYRFTGFRDGHLIVNSTLGGANSVLIGLDGTYIYPYVPAGSVFQPSVTLGGTNTYTGGTTLQSGLLVLGNASALGTGSLNANLTNAAAKLGTSAASLTIANPVDVIGYNNFTLGGSNNFTLSGNFTTSTFFYGTLNKSDLNTVVLSGDNSSFAAAINVASGTLQFGSDHAAGTGTLNLKNFDGVNDGQAVFTSSAPVIGGLYGESQTKLNVGPGTLTINQATDNSFDGQILGSGGLAKAGAGTLYLSGASVYSGGTTVSAGTLAVDGGSITHASSDLNVGSAASENGYLAVSAGGSVSTLHGFFGGSGIGTVDVIGAGSTLTAANEIIVGAFNVGGHGYLNVTGGGLVTAALGSIGYVGAGDVFIDGAGSTWNNTGRLYVGSGGGNGHLTVMNGGVVLSDSGEVGLDSGTGNAVVKGAGSMWAVTTGIDVGNNLATGVLEVFGQGALNVAAGAGTITLGVNTGGNGTLIIGESEYSPYGGVVNAAAITSGIGTGEVRFDTNMTATTPYFLTKDGTAGGAPVLITGSLAVKNLFGFNVLNGANTYSGGTTISGGTLVAGSNSALGTGTIVISGGNLSVASGVTLTNALDLTAGGLLGGRGTFGGPVTIGPYVQLAPGNSVGLLTFSGGTTWGPGGTYDVEVQAASGARGVGYDSIDVTGGLTFNATLGSPFTINLISLDVSGASGAVSDFNSGSGYAWVIAHTDTLTGFNPAFVTLNTGSFSNSIGTGGFYVSAVGNDVYLNFSPVPEPSTYALLSLGLGAGLLWFRRRRSEGNRLA